MAHFKRGNLQLKTNQQIQLGDSQESLILYDGTQLSLSHGAGELTLDANGISVIGDIDATGSVIIGGDLKGTASVFNILTSGDENAITINDNGGVELFHNNIKQFETISTGIRSGVSAFDIKTSGGEDGITINNNGAIELFHNNVKQVETISTGIQAGVAAFDIKTSGGEDGITINNDGGVELFFNNVKTLETLTGEIRLWEPGGSVWFELRYSGSDVFLQNRSLGGATQFWGRDGGGVNRGLITASPNNAVTLFYQGVRQFATIATGIQASSTITAFDIKTSGGEDGITINNDGSVELFYDNSLKLATDATGVTVIGNLTTNDLTVDGNTIYLGGTPLTEAAGGGLKIDGDLEVTGSLNLPEGSVEASDVAYAEVAGSTYSTVQEAMDQLGSAGLIEGGIISLDGTTSVNVTAGSGMLRTSNDIHAPLVFIDFPETLSIPIPGDDTKNIVVNYNSGTPIVEAIDPGTFNANTYFILGQVGRAEDDLIISNLRQRISDFSARILGRLYSTGAIVRVGQTGLILGESADTNRYVTMTEGDVWALLDIESLSAINTGTGDDFTTIYRDTPSGYVETPGETQWDMLSYDDGSGTLKDLSNGRYGVRWFWLIPSDENLFMVYGTGNWRSLAEAEAEPVPTDIPSLLGDYGILLGRIIVLKNEDIAVEVSTSFDTTYDFSGVTDHGNLSNLGSPADDHTQYSLVTGARDFTGTVGGLDPVAATDFVTLQYMATLGTDRTRLTYDGTTDLDISIEHIVDIKYAEFQKDLDPPPWKEGRVFWDRDSNTFGVYNDVSEVTLQVGQEIHVKVRNETGSLISNGAVVYVSGASGGRALISLAKADSIGTSEQPIMVTHDISNNENGYATEIGLVRGLDTSQFIDGQEVFLSDTNAGELTGTAPSAPNYVTHVGNVVGSDSTAGSILVNTYSHGDFSTLADVDIPTPPTNGQTLVYNEDNEYWQPETQLKTLTYSLPLAGVVDAVVPLTGTFTTNASGVTGDDATDYAISNQHVWLLINSITGSGYITITGTSLSESTAIPVTSDTETIYVSDATSTGLYFQTNKKWWEISNIDIPAGISAIDYDHGAIGYPDLANRNFKILGYRIDAMAAADNADFSIVIEKIQDEGDKEMSIITLENIGVDSEGGGDEISDNLRIGADDRSYNPTVGTIWPNNGVLTFKQLDFETYFTNDEYIVNAAEGDSGFLIRIQGQGGGISQVDFVTMYLYYALL